MEIINMLLTDLVPYEKNPRKNDEAVKMVECHETSMKMAVQFRPVRSIEVKE